MQRPHIPCKIFVVVLIHLVFASPQLYSQWERVEHDSEWMLLDVIPISPDHMLILANSGILDLNLSNWKTQVRLQYDRDKVGFATQFSRSPESRIYVARSGGVLIATVDSGVSWQPIRMPTAGYRRGMDCLNDSLCYIYPYGESIQRTTDCGKTWEVVEIDRKRSWGTPEFLKVYEDGKGIIVGEHSYVAQSSDSGSTWNFVSPRNGIDSAEASIQFIKCVRVGENALLAIAIGGIWKSENWGESWKLMWPEQDDDLGISPNDIAMAGSYGVVVGAGGLIVETHDGGESWKQVSAPVDTYLSGIALRDSTSGVIVGEGGVILRLNPSWQGE